MKRVLVDTSVWVDYLSGNRMGDTLNGLIDSNLICVNDLILSEIIPVLQAKRQDKLIRLFESVKKIPLTPKWDEIIRYQSLNLKNGIARAGIPDLLLIQNAVQNSLSLFTLDRLFYQMRKALSFDLYEF